MRWSRFVLVWLGVVALAAWAGCSKAGDGVVADVPALDSTEGPDDQGAPDPAESHDPGLDDGVPTEVDVPVEADATDLPGDAIETADVEVTPDAELATDVDVMTDADATPDAPMDSDALADGDGPAEIEPDPDVPTEAEVEVPACTVDDDCSGKVVLGPCDLARCVAGACVKTTATDGVTCMIGDLCQLDTRCQGGQCVGTDRNCATGSPCRAGRCDALTGCGWNAVSGPCDDGSKCTTGDQCQAGACQGIPVDCNDGNDCTTDGCDPAIGCTHQALATGACDAKSTCLANPHCVDGKCVGTAIDCDDHSPCTLDTCDPVAGCQHKPLAGSKCDDADPCTRDDRCLADGSCKGGDVPCDDGNPCTDDVCVGGGCQHVLNSAPCDDQNPCTLNDACTQGACAGIPMACASPPPNDCQGAALLAYDAQGTCAAGQCSYASHLVACPQGCAAGGCVGDPCAAATCQQPPSECFQSPGACAAGSCSYGYDNGKACDDRDPCTDHDACLEGLCQGARRLCNHPPSDVCADAKTLFRYSLSGSCESATGLCAYGTTLVLCAGGCVDGVCVTELGLLQAELDPGGQNGMSDPTRVGTCVMPGWFAPEPLKSTTYTMTGGFEP